MDSWMKLWSQSESWGAAAGGGCGAGRWRARKILIGNMRNRQQQTKTAREQQQKQAPSQQPSGGQINRPHTEETNHHNPQSISDTVSCDTLKRQRRPPELESLLDCKFM